MQDNIIVEIPVFHYTGLTLLNSLPNEKMASTKLKAWFADNKSDVAEMIISFSEQVENIVGKGENAGNQHILLFPQCFQKVLSQGR